jgi:hypothetical protein
MYRPEALLQAAVRVLKGADAPATKAAAAAATAGEPVFFMPPRPVGGMPVTIYVNKARLYDGMRSAPNMCLTVGFNGWTLCDPVKVRLAGLLAVGESCALYAHVVSPTSCTAHAHCPLSAGVHAPHQPCTRRQP